MPDGRDAVHLQQHQDLLQETLSLGRYAHSPFKTVAHKKTAKARYVGVML